MKVRRQTACGARRRAALSAVISCCSSDSEKSQMPHHLGSVSTLLNGSASDDITQRDCRVYEVKPREARAPVKPDHPEVKLSTPKGRQPSSHDCTEGNTMTRDALDSGPRDGSNGEHVNGPTGGRAARREEMHHSDLILDIRPQNSHPHV